MSLMPPEYWVAVAVCAAWLFNLVVGTAIREGWRKSRTNKQLTALLTEFFNSLAPRP